ncbi:MAG TPA: hypothetical protein ACFYEK_15280 [Candidatus Wunengus sp. YC60]|uniref:hypothetical protein n=1 Tax=Candidatus Wunengus sp. YC60 TaxID=3367697 RepID=UPI004027C742
MEKLTEKSQVFQALRNTGKSIQDAYRMAGYKGDVNGSAPYKIEGKIRNYALTDPKLLKTAKKVAKHVLEIAEDTLKNRRDDPAIQTLCVKSAIQIIEGQQDRIEPKKNINFNANLDIPLVDYSKYRNARVGFIGTDTQEGED